MEKFTMFAKRRASANKKDIGYYMIVNSAYKVTTLSKADVIKAIKTGREFTNLGLNADGEIVSTNGAMDKYTTIVGRELDKNFSYTPVILSRVEVSGNLTGYVMLAPNGNIVKIKIADAVKVYEKFGIANGKIRHTDNGDIISSISGSYPIMEYDFNETDDSISKVSVVTDIMIVGATFTENGIFPYVGFTVKSDSLKDLTALRRMLEKDVELFKKQAESASAPEKIKNGSEVIPFGGLGLYGLHTCVFTKELLSKSTLKNTPKAIASVIVNGEESIAQAKVADGKILIDTNTVPFDKKKYFEKLQEILNKVK